MRSVSTWLFVPVMLLSAAAVGLLIASLVSTVRRSRLFRVPLRDSQEVEFAAAGRVALNIEGPRFSTRFAHLKYELIAAGGTPVPGRLVLLRTSSSSMSTSRLEILKYDIPQPGRYLLRIHGLGDEQARDTSHGIVFTKPQLPRIMASIIGLVFSAGAFITSLVFLLLRLNKVI